MPDNSPGLSESQCEAVRHPRPRLAALSVLEWLPVQTTAGRLGDPTCHATATTKCKSRSGGTEAGLERMIEIRAKGCNSDD